MALGLAIEYIRQKKLKRRELYPTLQTGQAVGYPDWLRTHRAGGTANGSVAGRIKRWLEAEWPVIKPLAILLALFVLVSLILFSGR